MMTLEVKLMLEQQKCEELIQEESSQGPPFAIPECRRIWDGILCWAPAKPDVHSMRCPSYFYGSDVTANATKICTEDGWWIHPNKSTTWTNFSDCPNDRFATLSPIQKPIPDPLLQALVPWIKATSEICYIVSIASLLLACAILLSNRKLRCPRNIIHFHLFGSFLFRASMALLKNNLFFEGVGFHDDILHYSQEIKYVESFQNWQCKVFMTFWEYFILANYSWILVEGVYLHNLIFMALFTDTSSIAQYVTLGWSLPVVFVLPWAAARALYDDGYCWTMHTNKLVFLIIEIPTVASIVINLLLFINITRVLLIKLKRSSSFLIDRRISRYRKWAKSTLVLMPLYGVHYALFLGLSYSSDPYVEAAWLFCDQLFASSQGLCVSILFCIINGEVIQVMKTNWKNLKKRFNKRQQESYDMVRRGNSVQQNNILTDLNLNKHF